MGFFDHQRDDTITKLTSSMHQANEHRLTSIEGWIRLNVLAVMMGAVLMGIQLMGLKEEVKTTNGRLRENERRAYTNQNDLRIVRWVGATILSVLIPVTTYVIINAIGGT